MLMSWSKTVGPPTLNLQWSDLAALGFLVSTAAVGMWGKPRAWARGAWGIAAYVMLLLPSFINTTHPAASSLALVKTVYLAVLSVAITRWVLEVTAWERLVQVFGLTVGMIVLLTIGLWSYAWWSGRVPEPWAVAMVIPNVGQTIRVSATLYTHSLLANYLTFGIPLLAGYVAAKLPWPRAAGWGVILAGILAAVATASHSLAGCLVAAALIAPRTTRWDRLGARGMGMLAVIVTIFALVSTTVATHGVHAARAPAPTAPDSRAPHEFLGPSGTGEELTVRIRYAWVSYGLLKRLAWETWRDHPWSGLGLGEFPYAVERAFTAGRLHYPWLDPHSTWLGSLAETGLLGLGGLLGLWMAFLWPALRQWTRSGQVAEGWRIRAPLAGLLGLLVNSLHVDIMHFRFLWLGAALLLAEVVRQNATDRPHGIG